MQVGVSHQVESDQGEQHDNHHIPSEHHVRSHLHVKPVPTMSIHVGTQSNTVSTALPPAVQHVSVVLDNKFRRPAILRQNEKNQVFFEYMLDPFPENTIANS